jgi:hypothetical protein
MTSAGSVHLGAETSLCLEYLIFITKKSQNRTYLSSQVCEQRQEFPLISAHNKAATTTSATTTTQPLSMYLYEVLIIINGFETVKNVYNKFLL